MHRYGDDWPHWDKLHRAIYEVLDYWRKYRLGSHGKEKWGTFRDHVYWSDGTLHSLVYPGYVYIQWRWFYYNIDYPIIRRLVYYSGLLFLLNRWQRFIYRRGIELALRKYPEVVYELTCELDYPELLLKEYKNDNAN